MAVPDSGKTQRKKKGNKHAKNLHRSERKSRLHRKNLRERIKNGDKKADRLLTALTLHGNRAGKFRVK